MSKISIHRPNVRRYAPIIVPTNHFWTPTVPQRVPFLWICASKGMDLGPNFVPVRIGVDKFCVTKVRGFALPS